jgi:hypothetical protein
MLRHALLRVNLFFWYSGPRCGAVAGSYFFSRHYPRGCFGARMLVSPTSVASEIRLVWGYGAGTYRVSP